MSEISVFDKYPDISFIDNVTLKETVEKCATHYEEHYKELTGEEIKLGETEPIKLLLDTIAYMHYQKLVYLDQLGKMNLLKYATGKFLDNLGANVSQPPRSAGKKSMVSMQVLLSKAQTEDYIVPSGTMFATDDDIFFESTAELIIPAGKVDGIVLCLCTETGTVGNGYEPGEVQTIVTALPYIQNVVNTTTSSGGEDEQSDEAYAESVYLATSRYNTTGNEDAYKYIIRQVSSQIGDIVIDTPTPLSVVITFLMKDGTIPPEELLRAVSDSVKSEFKKTLNDYVTVKSPSTVDFEIDIKYWINESDRKNAAEIHKKVESAIEKYKGWQSEKLGRDINPDMLRHFVIGAGAKRVEVVYPQYTIVKNSYVSVCNVQKLNYGGLEDD